MSDLAGMTVNERLFHIGLIDKFGTAIIEKNKEEAISILQKAELSKDQATETVTTILENPGYYGYPQN